MIVSSHQPDLLPYSGFFHKMAKADLFDLKLFDQFVQRGYQRRVKMRGDWVSIPIVESPWKAPIYDIRIHPEKAQEMLHRVVVGRYRGARYWKQRCDDVLGLIDSLNTDKLWHFNVDLILGMRDILGIKTPVAVAVAPVGGKSAGLVSVLKRYPAPLTYLSGTGARVYMGDCAEFTEAGITVEWSRHKPVTEDSVLTLLFDYPDPMELVLMEDDVEITPERGLVEST
jgi:hypothetical protein